MSEFELISKLGLFDFIKKFASYFSRKIGDDLNKDSINHILKVKNLKDLYDAINAIESISSLPILPCVKVLDNELERLKKGFFLHLKDIIEFMKIISFFNDFSSKDELDSNKIKDSKLTFLITYFSNIKIPNEILDLVNLFDLKNKKWLKSGADTLLDSYQANLDSINKEKTSELYSLLKKENLQEYLVDSNIHFIENQSTLLVRSGYSNVLKAKVIARSSSGYFYIIPLSLESLQSKIYTLQDKIEHRILELSKDFSGILSRHFLFLRFINAEFDFIDSAVARVSFARYFNLEFIYPKANADSIMLYDFIHPALTHKKDSKIIPSNIEMQKNLLMITGVNAGGKTMLLKSILSATLLAKYLIPMKININSSIPYYKNIAIIAQDPQDSNNDISTFSGRICEIAKILDKRDLLLGIDEIEIGTDSFEAASLYKAILESFLASKDSKIIVTTHHKHLASLMSSSPKTQLIAATCDYKNATPNYLFIDGIGKSYAFECALHYGIPQSIIDTAKKIHGDDRNNLEKLIESSNELITKNNLKKQELEQLISTQNEKIKELDSIKSQILKDFKDKELVLKRQYNEAIKELKMLAKKTNKEMESKSDKTMLQNITKKIHKTLNETHKKQDSNVTLKSLESSENPSFTLGQIIKYKGKNAKIIAIKNNKYDLEIIQNNMRVRGILAIELDSKTLNIESKKTYSLDMDVKADMRLDLHGLTKEEALERLESFFSNALAAKFSEVEIVHGIGSGTLKRLVENYLNSSKFVRGYNGTLAKKIVYLL